MGGDDGINIKVKVTIFKFAICFRKSVRYQVFEEFVITMADSVLEKVHKFIKFFGRVSFAFNILFPLIPSLETICFILNLCHFVCSV